MSPEVEGFCLYVHAMFVVAIAAALAARQDPPSHMMRDPPGVGVYTNAL